MQAGRDAVDVKAGERTDEHVPAAAVRGSRAAQVAVELAVLEERCKVSCSSTGAPRSDSRFSSLTAGARRGRQRGPAHPQRGRERLGHRVHVHDVVGREALSAPTGWRS